MEYEIREFVGPGHTECFVKRVSLVDRLKIISEMSGGINLPVENNPRKNNGEKRQLGAVLTLKARVNKGIK